MAYGEMTLLVPKRRILWEPIPVSEVPAKKVEADDPKVVPAVNVQGEVVQGISLVPKFAPFRKRYAGA